MSTTRFPARQLVKGLVFMTMLTACQSGSRPPSSDDHSTQVTSVSAAVADATASDAGRFPGACDGWSLTAAQAEAFFALSTEVDARTYHHEYDTSRCMIPGELVDNGRHWAFQINGVAKGYWSDGATMRYFGCAAPACEPLVLVPYIGMDP